MLHAAYATRECPLMNEFTAMDECVPSCGRLGRTATDPNGTAMEFVEAMDSKKN
jgi:hypothetical protein